MIGRAGDRWRPQAAKQAGVQGRSAIWLASRDAVESVVRSGLWWSGLLRRKAVSPLGFQCVSGPALVVDFAETRVR
jgi:hypothetical protein